MKFHPGKCKVVSIKVPGKCKVVSIKVPGKCKVVSIKVPGKCKVVSIKVPGKCKVVSIKSNANKLFYLNALPMSHYSYQLGNCILDYEESEKVLGVIVNSKFSWIEHQSLIISKASQMLELTKQTCHFLMNSTRKRTLYMSLVRSQFEHCSVIWRPENITQLQKFETIQKNTIK